MLKWFADRLARSGEEVREVRKDERGFTLIELLVVVIIIGILAAIAIPTFLAQQERAENSAVTSDLRNAATATQTYATANNGDYSGLQGDDGSTLGDNGATLSDGNNWGAITADQDTFSITIEGPNGSGTYDSDGDPQLQPVDSGNNN